ncbi:MAG: YfhO family protein [Phycisphaerae bacterium]|nr:YfhO family protein [Phycisphaerae bacterium]
MSSLLLGLPVVILAGAWRLGGVSALEDDLLFYLPARQYIGERIRAGEWPVWNPWVAMGTSVATDPQAGLWYPPTWLFALLPPLVAYPLTLVLHFALAGGGMYRFLRACRHDWRAALLAAIAFEFSGFLVAHRAHLTIHHAAAWLPWMFYAWRRFADTGRVQHWSAAALFFGMQMLVQHVQVSIIGGTLLSAYAVIVLWPGRRSLWWQYPAGMASGAMLSAIQLVPTWMQFAGSIRGAPAFYLFVENSWLPSSAAMMLFPMVFGTRTPNLWDQPWWGPSHFCEQSAYASILVLVLAMASVGAARGRRRETIFWWLACGVALVIALGRLTPVSRLLVQVPLYNSLRVPARWILVWSFAMPVLASLVMSVILKGKEPARAMGVWVRWAMGRVLPVMGGIVLLAMVVLRFSAARLATRFTSAEYDPVWAGAQRALHPANPAIWWPVLLAAVTGWCLLRWVADRRPLRLTLLFLVFLVDLASVAAFVDVDTRTYSRADFERPPPLAEAIGRLKPGPGDRLLVPRYSSDYQRPLEVLWPQTNVAQGIATFQGYGPLWPVANRLLLRFMPWGSSEEIVALLRNVNLCQALGIRFIVVRSDQERAMLGNALLPSARPLQLHEIPESTGKPRQVRRGRDVLWPVTVDRPGLYLLEVDATPVAGSLSRWFVRLETSPARSIGPMPSIDPVDLAAGPRRLRFHFYSDVAPGRAYLRIKADMGHALWLGRAAFGLAAAATDSSAAEAFASHSPFVHRADLPGGVSLYELPGSRPLWYWSPSVEIVSSLLEAVDRLQSLSIRQTTATVLEGRPGSDLVATCTSGPLAWQQVSGQEWRVQAESAGGGLLVFNQTYDLGWRASIDGRETPIYRANAVAQAVPVPSGRHEVRFVYRPPGFEKACVLSVTAAILLLGLAAATAGRPGTYKYGGACSEREAAVGSRP